MSPITPSELDPLDVSGHFARRMVIQLRRVGASTPYSVGIEVVPADANVSSSFDSKLNLNVQD